MTEGRAQPVKSRVEFGERLSFHDRSDDVQFGSQASCTHPELMDAFGISTVACDGVELDEVPDVLGQECPNHFTSAEGRRCAGGKLNFALERHAAYRVRDQ